MNNGGSKLKESIKRTLVDIPRYTTICYLIILTLSITYNIGYLKQVNPQLIDLMEIGDYFNSTIHNIWFYLFGAIIFFTFSLTSVRSRVKERYIDAMIFGIFTFTISIYFFLKGFYYSKFWPTFYQFFKINSRENNLSALAIILLLIISLTLIYFVFLKVTKKKLPNAIIATTMPLAFLFFVLMPYIGGMLEGYIETKYLSSKDYNRVNSVSIKLNVEDQILKDVYIIKILGKGIVIRQFINNLDQEGEKFRFINWGSILDITYKNIDEPLSPL